jgi:hypothetical protein
MCHLKSLIFDCISFTEGLITILFTANNEATTELFIKYFCSITLCCLWRFDEKLFVFKYCFIFIVLGHDTSTHGSRGGKDRCHKGSSGGRGLTCPQQTVRPLPPLEPLSPLCFPTVLPCVEVSCPKTINIKQYL